MALVFQYGSNCSEREINSDGRLRGDAQFVGVAETLEDFELEFDVWSRGRKCAASNIIRKDGGKVWGVLYEIPDYLMARATANAAGRKSFDQIEGEGTNYDRKPISVRRTDGSVVSAITYLVRDPVQGLKTNAEYVGHIARGLRERRINEDYIAKVKAIAVANNPDLAVELQRL